MEKILKLRISRIFKSSFDSCKSRNISDVIVENPVFVPQKQQQNLKPEPSNKPLSSASMHILKPHTRPLPSVCRPRCHDSSEPSKKSSLVRRRRRSSKTVRPRQKVIEKYSDLFYSREGHQHFSSCPPSSPVMFSLCSYETQKSKKKNKAKTKSYSRKTRNVFGKPNLPDENINNYYYGGNWFSSDDDSDTFFSSKSLSSESSESWRAHSSRRRRVLEIRSGLLPEKAVYDSFAVVKCSSDPYNDFRTSMVEMIIEKQIFGDKDLENLLQCFLSLNSSHHHTIIVEVFMEIWEALFSNWP